MSRSAGGTCTNPQVGDRAASQGRSQIDPKQSLVAGDRNGEKCPTPAVRDPRRDRLKWVKSEHLDQISNSISGVSRCEVFCPMATQAQARCTRAGVSPHFSKG
jgi:hypothetical protein